MFTRPVGAYTPLWASWAHSFGASPCASGSCFAISPAGFDSYASEQCLTLLSAFHLAMLISTNRYLFSCGCDMTTPNSSSVLAGVHLTGTVSESVHFMVVTWAAGYLAIRGTDSAATDDGAIDKPLMRRLTEL